MALKMLTKIVVCHEDMTGKRGGENVVGMNMNAMGMSILLFPMEFLCFGRKKTFIT